MGQKQHIEAEILKIGLYLGKRRQTLVTAFGAFSPRSPEFGILTEKISGKIININSTSGLGCNNIIGIEYIKFAYRNLKIEISQK